MLERTGPDGLLICARCGKPILHKYDCIGHHRIELNDDNVNDYSISLNPDNVELIHFKCHNKEHKRFDGTQWTGFQQRVYIVWGSPCSGKSTWVNENANDDDLILDLDRIWGAICNSDREHKPGRLKAVVFAIRDEMINQIKTRSGKWRCAYVIGGYPHDTDRQRLADLLRAELIHIDTSKEVCMDRAPNDEWRGFIEEWWDDYTPPFES